MKRAMTGFTLVELLVVIAILAILGGMVMLAAGTTRQSASRADAARVINSLYMGFEQYKSENGQYPMTIKTASILDGETPNSNSTYALEYHPYSSASYNSGVWTFKMGSTTLTTTAVMILEQMKLFSFDHENLVGDYLADGWGNYYMIKSTASQPLGWPTLDYYIYSTGGATKTAEYIYKK